MFIMKLIDFGDELICEDLAAQDKIVTYIEMPIRMIYLLELHLNNISFGGDYFSCKFIFEVAKSLLNWIVLFLWICQD